MKKLKLLVFTMMLLMVGLSSQAQDKFRNQAMFVYNFTRMNAWPHEVQAGDFVIAVFGNSPIHKELSLIAESRQVGNRRIVVKQFDNIEDIAKCQMLFIPPLQSRNLPEITQKLKQDKIAALLITDSRNTLDAGAAVNFIVSNDRQLYEVSESNAKALGITLGSDMIRLSATAKK